MCVRWGSGVGEYFQLRILSQGCVNLRASSTFDRVVRQVRTKGKGKGSQTEKSEKVDGKYSDDGGIRRGFRREGALVIS